MKSLAVCAAAAALVIVGCGSADRIIVAAGTTLVDSGAAAALVDAYEKETGLAVSVVGVSSQEALLLLDAGETAVALTHSPAVERAFALDNPRFMPTPVFSSRFTLSGPEGSADHFAGMTMEESLRAIHEDAVAFVSRNDASGTAAKEADAWRAVGLDPDGEPWRTVTGEGMGTTLQVADQRGAVLLTELGALLGAENVDVVAFETVEGSVSLDNPYTMWHEAGSDTEVDRFVQWVLENGAAVLATFAEERWGAPVYSPVGG